MNVLYSEPLFGNPNGKTGFSLDFMHNNGQTVKAVDTFRPYKLIPYPYYPGFYTKTGAFVYTVALSRVVYHFQCMKLGPLFHFIQTEGQIVDLCL